MKDIDMKDYVGGQEEGEELKKVENNKLTINDFKIIKVIGKGSYGKVLLVKKTKKIKYMQWMY